MSQEIHDASPVLLRRCRHYGPQVSGADYAGRQYVAALQRLGATAAARVAGKVESFFWRDAPKVRVWLCAECARELGL